MRQTAARRQCLSFRRYRRLLVASRYPSPFFADVIYWDLFSIPGMPLQVPQWHSAIFFLRPSLVEPVSRNELEQFERIPWCTVSYRYDSRVVASLLKWFDPWHMYCTHMYPDAPHSWMNQIVMKIDSINRGSALLFTCSTKDPPYQSPSVLKYVPDHELRTSMGAWLAYGWIAFNPGSWFGKVSRGHT